MAFLKTLAVATLILSISVFLFKLNPEFIHIHPHPFLFVASLGAALMGFRSTWLSILLLVGGYLGMLAMTVDLGEVETFWSFQNLLEPIAIFFLPATLGAMRDLWNATDRENKQKIEEKDKSLTELDRVIQIYREDNLRLERLVTSRLHPIARMVEDATAAENLSFNAKAEIFLQQIADELNEDSIALYWKKGATLERAALLGPEDEQTYPEVINEQTLAKYPLVQYTLNERDVGRPELFADKKLSGLTSPILSSNNQVLGVIVLKKVGFVHYFARTFTTLAALGRWGGWLLQD